jgi:translocator assembly and maintenance protein 41
LSVLTLIKKILGLTEIIAGTAITQSIKGIFTAGTLKTGRYAGAKLSKWWSAKK